MIIKDNMANMCAKVTSTYMEFTLAFGPKPEFSFSFKFTSSDELDAKIFLQKAEQMFTQTDTYGIIFAWKKIYLIQIKTNFHMVEDMSILCSIILSGVQSTEKRF